MKSWILLPSVIVLSLGAASLSWLQRGPSVGYAETAVLMSEFSESIKARKEFEASQKEWDRNLALLNDSLTTAMETMKSRYDRASAVEKDAMRALLEKRNDDLHRYTEAVRRMSQDKEQELTEPVVRKINTFLASWGEKHGYDLILGTLSGGNILQADPRLNVTRRVLKDLNAEYRDLPEKKSAAVPSPEDLSAARPAKK
jgi:outer membrane protein